MLSGAQNSVWRKQELIERVRRETTAALAHELKTPLSVLSATAELLGDNLAPEKQAHYLGCLLYTSKIRVINSYLTVTHCENQGLVRCELTLDKSNAEISGNDMGITGYALSLIHISVRTATAPATVAVLPCMRSSRSTAISAA